MAQEAGRDDPEVGKLRTHLEEANNKLKGASIEYMRMMDALAKAQIDNGQVVANVKVATNCYRAMCDNRDKLEWDLEAKAKEAINLATRLGMAQIEPGEEKKRNK